MSDQDDKCLHNGHVEILSDANTSPEMEALRDLAEVSSMESSQTLSIPKTPPLKAMPMEDNQLSPIVEMSPIECRNAFMDPQTILEMARGSKVVETVLDPMASLESLPATEKSPVPEELSIADKVHAWNKSLVGPGAHIPEPEAEPGKSPVEEQSFAKGSLDVLEKLSIPLQLTGVLKPETAPGVFLIEEELPSPDRFLIDDMMFDDDKISVASQEPKIIFLEPASTSETVEDRKAALEQLPVMEAAIIEDKITGTDLEPGTNLLETRAVSESLQVKEEPTISEDSTTNDMTAVNDTISVTAIEPGASVSEPKHTAKAAEGQLSASQQSPTTKATLDKAEDEVIFQKPATTLENLQVDAQLAALDKSLVKPLVKPFETDTVEPKVVPEDPLPKDHLPITAEDQSLAQHLAINTSLKAVQEDLVIDRRLPTTDHGPASDLEKPSMSEEPCTLCKPYFDEQIDEQCSVEDTSKVAPADTTPPVGRPFIELQWPLTGPICVARNQEDTPCAATPRIPCPKCLLVAYCGPRCQEADWNHHKEVCQSVISYPRVTETNIKDLPTSGQRSFWAGYAATDILNLEKNEGAFYDDDLSILLAGDAGLRHLIYSVVLLPYTATPKLDVVLCETDPTIFARSLFVLLLLLDRSSDPVLNAEVAVHLWYSAKMPRPLYEHFKHIVGGAFDKACVDVEAVRNRTSAKDAQNVTADWVNRSGTARIRVDVEQDSWKFAKSVLEPIQLSASEARIIRMLDAKNTEPIYRAFARMTPARALGLQKWLDDGLLLPYGYPRDHFDTLNPLFFQSENGFPTGAIAEPLSEWPMELLDCAGGRARNDVYGKMFYYLRNMFFKFHERIKEIGLSVRLYSKDVQDVKNFILFHGKPQQFDRIELGNLWDLNPLLCHVAFTKLLRHQDENPFATMLAITRQCVTEPIHSTKKLLEQEKSLLYSPSGTQLDEFAPPVDASDMDLRSVLRRQLGLLVWRNWDQYADRYHNHGEIFDFASWMLDEPAQDERSAIATGHLGLELKIKNSITLRWPNRLIYNKTSKPTLKEFNRWIGWANVMPERWLEWKKVRDVRNDEWVEWVEVILTAIGADDGRDDVSMVGSLMGARVEIVEVPKTGETTVSDKDTEEDQDGKDEKMDESDDSGIKTPDAKLSPSLKRTKKSKKTKQKRKKR